MKRRLSFVLLVLVSFMIISLNLYLSTNRIVKDSFYENPVVFSKDDPIQIQPSNSYSNVYNDCNYLKSVSDGKYILNKFPCDLLITVKTTQRFHESRMRILIDTWFGLIPNKTYFISDAADPLINHQIGGHLVVSKCENKHNHHDLVCKMMAEFEVYFKNPTNWYCHFDDDNYLNVERLYQVLQAFNPNGDWYLGRKSTSRKIESHYQNKIYRYWFATGGAGFCISHSLIFKMKNYITNMNQIAQQVGLPDDCTIGLIIEGFLGVNLVELEYFRSHFDFLRNINNENIKDQISISYGKANNFVNVKLSNNQTVPNDPTIFKTVHCILYPNEKFCKQFNVLS